MSNTNKTTNEKKNRMKIALGAAAIVAVGGGVIGFAVYQNYQDVYGTYCKIGNHEVSKLEYDFFYHSAINNFQNTYSSYLSMLGVDFSKDLGTQEYSDGKTWEQYFQEQAVQLMKEVYILSDAADEAKYEATDDTYNSFYENVARYSKQYEITQEEYIKQMYGTSATKKNLEKILKTYFKAADYATYMQETSLLPSDEEIETYYNENKDEFDRFDYRIFAVAADPAALESNTEVSADSENEKSKEEAKQDNEEQETAETASESTENKDEESKEEVAGENSSETNSSEESEDISVDVETEKDSTGETSDSNKKEYSDEEWQEAMEIAKNKANEFYEQVYDEETFKELCVKYAGSEEEKQTYTSEDFSLNSKIALNAMPSAIQSWMSDEAREPKSTAVIEDSENHMYYIVYFVNRQRVETPTVNVRHILIMPEEVEELPENATEEEKAAHDEKVKAANEAAKEKAEKIYQEWKDGDATIDSFAALADKNSDDSASGGFYGNVEQGQMVEGFDDWIFAEGRKEGDTDIVESSYGYHIMYFEGYDDPAWKVSATSALVQENYKKFVEDKMDEYEFEDVRGELEYLTAANELDEISEQLEDDEEVENSESTETPETPENSKSTDVSEEETSQTTDKTVESNSESESNSKDEDADKENSDSIKAENKENSES